MRFTAKLVVNNLPRIADAARPKASAVVRKTAHDIEADWKAGVHVDTGAYRNSIHVVPDGDLAADIVSDVEHSIYNEMGTYKMPARPAATPAAERARQPFIDAMSKVFD